MKTLIVVDMQNDFITGTLGTPEAKRIVPKVQEKIRAYLAAGDEVIFTRDTHDSAYFSTNEGRHLPTVHCLKGTTGWEVCAALENEACEHIDKPTFGYTKWQTRQDGSKRQFSELELVGVCTDICVVSNALLLKAMFPEIPITVDASCCAGVTPDAHRAALQTMRSCQIHIIGEDE